MIHIDTLLWFVINASYIIGGKIARPRKKPKFTDKGLPQFFYELVQYWVAFDLVIIFSKYGLMPTLNENLMEWSSDLHCIVQLLSKQLRQQKTKNVLHNALIPSLTKIQQKTGDTLDEVN